MILAAANNHLECVRELLKQGADPAARRLVSKSQIRDSCRRKLALIAVIDKEMFRHTRRMLLSFHIFTYCVFAIWFLFLKLLYCEA